MINVFKRKGKNWLNEVKVEELEKERFKIDSRLELIAKEIEMLEKKKEELFHQGIGKPREIKILLAEKIKDVEAEIRLKKREYGLLMKQRRVLTNLIMLKRWQSKLEKVGIWSKIASLDADTLFDKLAEVELKDEDFEKKLDKLLQVFEMRHERAEALDEETRRLLEQWDKVERAELAPEEAVKEIKEEKEAKEKKELEPA